MEDMTRREGLGGGLKGQNFTIVSRESVSRRLTNCSLETKDRGSIDPSVAPEN